MSQLKTMMPVASVLALVLATVASAETARTPARPVVSPTKAVTPMEGKCGGNMRMKPAASEAGKSSQASKPKAMEGRCGGMK